MIIGSIIGIAVTVSGGFVFAYTSILLIKNIAANRVPAVIMSYHRTGGRSGIVIFVYKVFASSDFVLCLERKVLPLGSVLPLYSMNRYVGRHLMVPYDARKQKLLPHEPILIIYMLSALMLMVLGGIILYTLYRIFP